MSLVLWTLQKSAMESLKKDSTKLNALKTNSSISIRWLSKKYHNQFHAPLIAYKIKSIAKLIQSFLIGIKNYYASPKVSAKTWRLVPRWWLSYILCVFFSFTYALLYLLLHAGITLVSFKMTIKKSILGFYQRLNVFVSCKENTFVWQHVLR